MNQTGANQNAVGVSGVLPPGAKLGKYVIVERLGSGGEAIVYKGHDPLLDRYVAIKQVVPQLATEEKFAKRFREVVRHLARLDSDHVVTIFELMEEGGGLFVVMEFVEGHTIETSLSEQPGPADPKAVVQVIWRIASGLSAIHKSGIVHRDIKPGNIIIGEGLRVKITDFGVAARAGQAVSMRLGTTKYMAPELFAGAEADARADIYSLGMIAYEMLLGRTKFNEVFHDVVRDPHSEALRWMKWHSSPEKVAPPLAEINPDIPQALSAIVGRMLAKDTEQRFAGVEELGMEIRANFSPRARQPSGKKRRGGKRPVEAGVIGDADQTEAAFGDKRDEDTSTTPDGEPITAEIPKEAMSLRNKLTIVGVIAGVVLAGAVAYLVVEGSKQKKLRDQASKEYFQALDQYTKGEKDDTSDGKKNEFDAAQKAFGRIFKGYGQLGVSRQAQVMELLCKAQLSVLERDWKATDDNTSKAGKLIGELQRTEKAMLEWTRRMDRKLQEFGVYWNNQRKYGISMERARKAVDDGNLEEGRRILWDEGREYAAMSEQTDAIQTLLQEISEKQQQKEFFTHITDGEKYAKDGNVDDAIKEWDKAISVLESAKGTLPAKIYSDLKKVAEKKKTELRIKTRLEKIMAEITKAEEAGNLLAAADACEKANNVKPDGKLLAKARDFRHDHHLQLGRKYLSVNDLQKAEDAFKKAKTFKASGAADKELKKIEQRRNYGKMVGQANGLFRQKKYEEALKKYSDALKISAGSSSVGDVREKVTDCRYFIAIKQAQDYRAKGEWAKAEAAYKKAKRIKRAAAAEVDAHLQLMGQDREYAEQMSAAQEALKKRDYTNALIKARGAKKIRTTPEVGQLIKLINYERHKEQGQKALERADYPSAAAYFRLAKGFMATPEIDKLIKKAEKLMKEES